MIERDTTIARVLDEHPALLDVLAGYHAHFARLRNRLLRRVMAPRVTVAEAARIAGVSPDDLLATLRRAAGQAPLPPATAAAVEDGAAGEPRPAALDAIPASRVVHLDVRGDICSGAEPFPRIMRAVKHLGPGQVLALRAPFEPIPLYSVLGQRGFAHWTERTDGDDWLVWFYRSEPVNESQDRGAAPPAASSAALTLDVRGLDPPLPMVRVLERLDTLAPGETLEVLHSRRPLFLYPQLDERGFAHETDAPESGVVRIRIRHRAAAP